MTINIISEKMTASLSEIPKSTRKGVIVMQKFATPQEAFRQGNVFLGSCALQCPETGLTDEAVTRIAREHDYVDISGYALTDHVDRRGRKTGAQEINFYAEKTKS